MASKKYPPEIRTLAYTLHGKGFLRPQIAAQLDDYCRKKLKMQGPTTRTIDQWRIEDDWEAQDEIAKSDLAEKLRARVVDEKLSTLERYSKLISTTYDQYLQQVKEGVRLSPGQAIYALVELERERLKIMEGQSKGPNVRKILESAMEPFVEILRKLLGTAFTEKQDEIFNELERKLKALNRGSGA
jgi:hypothetical protein